VKRNNKKNMDEVLFSLFVEHIFFHSIEFKKSRSKK
jgi:hypothetical protein